MEYEGYSEEEAAYAAEHCGADWREQALFCAKENLDSKNFGYGPLSLQESLERDGFTSEQITYALENCNPDWKEQALKLAIHHTESSGMPSENLYDLLIHHYGFSEKEAQYALDHCNAD